MSKRSRYYLPAAVIVAAAVYMIVGQSSSPGISVYDVYEQMNDSSVVVLDVRTMREHIDARIKETALIPVEELEQRILELDRYKEKKIIVYCRTDNRSGYATAFLRERGFDAYNMNGGIVRWKSEQLPIINGAIQ